MELTIYQRHLINSFAAEGVRLHSALLAKVAGEAAAEALRADYAKRLADLVRKLEG